MAAIIVPPLFRRVHRVSGVSTRLGHNGVHVLPLLLATLPGTPVGFVVNRLQQGVVSVARDARSIGFAVSSKDAARLDRLTKRFAGGNRSAFLRIALDRMEAADRAERLRRLQAYGVRRAADRGIQQGDIESVVDRVLGRKPRG